MIQIIIVLVLAAVAYFFIVRSKNKEATYRLLWISLIQIFGLAVIWELISFIISGEGSIFQNSPAFISIVCFEFIVRYLTGKSK